MNNTFDFKVKQLTRVMSDTHKRWAAGSPPISDIANALKQWIGDIERLSYYSESNTQAWNAAKAAISDAWDKRVERKDAVRFVGDAVAALKALPAELEQPLEQGAYARRTTKSLFGNVAAHSPSLFNELYNIRRQLAAYAQTGALGGLGNSTKSMGIKGLAAGLIEIGQRYEQQTPMYQYATQAAGYLNRAVKLGRPEAVKRYLEEALNAVDNLGATIDRNNAPDGYKPDFDKVSAASVKSLVDSAKAVSFSCAFEAPDVIIAEMTKRVNRVASTIKSYDDQRAARLVLNTQTALQAAKDKLPASRVKTLGQQSWDYPPLQEAFNVALLHLDTLEQHLTNVR